MLRAARAKFSSTVGAVDDQHRVPAERARTARRARWSWARRASALSSTIELALGLLGRQRGLERELAHLLLQVELVAAHDRPEDHARRRGTAASAGAWRARPVPFWRVRLLGRAVNVADALGLVRAGAALGELPVDHARQDVAAHRQAEHLVGEIDRCRPLCCRGLMTCSFMSCAPRPRRARRPRGAAAQRRRERQVLGRACAWPRP